jgi:elongator complex protein 3
MPKSKLKPAVKGVPAVSGPGLLEKAWLELLDTIIKNNVSDQSEIQNLKNQISQKYGVPSASNVELIAVYRKYLCKAGEPENRDLLKLLRKRAVRTQSGIANITVLTKAWPCPGKCIFCPTEPGMPKSYLSNEPAMMRAILNNFDSYRQTRNRLISLKKTGHFTDKVDVVVAGGTFSFYPKRYQSDFTRGIYNALNYPAPKARSLAEAQKINENAENRCIGLSFETRPDHIDEQELKHLRKLGCTKIEIGVQSLNDRVLELNQRGHTTVETCRAIQLMRDAAYKINVHMMPNLLGSTPEIDLADMKELFENTAYRPDWMKVYPCMVVPWTRLEQIYKKGEYKSYDDRTLIDLMVEMTKIWPEYVRVTRMYRDIPADTIVSGSKASNLRQFVEKELQRRKIVPRDIRSREIKGEKIVFDQLQLKIMEFEASQGQEFFISYEQAEKDKLCSLLRLRFSSYSLRGKQHFIPELEGAALIREVHTYGEVVQLKNRKKDASQHIGLGRLMMQKAEELAVKNGYGKMAVIAGIGVRNYYKKLGYQLEGTYMTKKL